MASKRGKSSSSTKPTSTSIIYLYELASEDVTWITRAKDNMSYRVAKRRQQPSVRGKVLRDVATSKGYLSEDGTRADLKVVQTGLRFDKVFNDRAAEKSAAADRHPVEFIRIKPDPQEDE